MPLNILHTESLIMLHSVAAAPKEYISVLWAPMSLLLCLSSYPSSLSFFLTIDKQWEAGLSRNDEAQTQTSKEEEEEGPQRATETCVCLRALLQRHPGGHQGLKPQRHFRGCLQDCGFHVGQPGRGTEAGTKHAGFFVSETIKWIKIDDSHTLSLTITDTITSQRFNFHLLFTNTLKCTPPHAHILVQPVDGMCATAAFPWLMCCVISRTLLWDTAHLNELVILFLKIIHPFIPTPLIKIIFLLNLIQAQRGGEGCVFCGILRHFTSNK